MRILVYGMSGKILGGIETFLLNISNQMDDNLIFDYIIEGENCIYSDTIIDRHGKIFFIPEKKQILKHIAALYSLFKNNSYSVIYFNLFSFSYAIPVFLSILFRKKTILHAHTSGFETTNRIFKMLHYFNRFVFGFFNVERFTNSELSADFMFGKKKNKAVIIHNAIDLERFKYDENIRQKTRLEYGLEGKIVIGFVGRLVFAKNPFFIIDVFSEIVKILPNAILLFVGEGPLKSQLKDYVKLNNLSDKATFLGKKEDIQKYFQVMDLFLFPSKFEGLGLALIEAQVSGLLCFTSADVVPTIAKISDLLYFLPLSDSPDKWAKSIVSKIQEKDYDRNGYYEIALNSNYNIKTEAKRLENIILNY